MFKFSQSQLPSKFNDYFSRVTFVHYYTTRSSTSAFMLPFCRTTIRQKCIHYQGPSVCYSLPSHIKLVDSTAAFKILHQQYLINRY